MKPTVDAIMKGEISSVGIYLINKVKDLELTHFKGKNQVP
jgi:hypothetical protein